MTKMVRTFNSMRGVMGDVEVDYTTLRRLQVLDENVIYAN